MTVARRTERCKRQPRRIGDRAPGRMSAAVKPDLLPPEVALLECAVAFKS